MKSLLCALLLLAAVPFLCGQQSAPPATPGPAATAVLLRAVARYGDGAAHEASFVQIYTPAGFTAARRESGTL